MICYDSFNFGGVLDGTHFGHEIEKREHILVGTVISEQKIQKGSTMCHTLVLKMPRSYCFCRGFAPT